MSEEKIKKATDHFEKLLREQLERVERMKVEPDWTLLASQWRGSRSGCLIYWWKRGLAFYLATNAARSHRQEWR